MVTCDEDGIPLGWELVRLTEQERDALVGAAELGDIEAADAIVEGAYDRLFGQYIN